jgi:hypothetical protein
MCDVKLEIPFQKQESIIDEEHSFNRITIPYQDPTTFENVSLNSTSLTKSFWKGKVIFDVSGDICKNEDLLTEEEKEQGDKRKTLTLNGILRVEEYKAGPLETKGGIVQFKRLYFHFRDLEIPIKIIYRYDPETICEDNIINPIRHLTKIDKNELKSIQKRIVSTTWRDMYGDMFQFKISDFDYFHIQDGSNNRISTDEKRFDIEVIRSIDSNLKFNRYFVTNQDNENNMNPLFNNLEPYFKKYDSSFNLFYDTLVSGLNDISFSEKIEIELKRIICETKDEDVKNIYVSFNDKINHLKERDLYSLIFHESNRYLL